MNDIQQKEFEVLIPNDSGDAILERVTVMIPVKWDEEIQDFLLTPEAHKIIDDTKARHMGLLLPNEIKNLRQRLGLSQKEICELLQMGEKSWVRWETGHTRPSRSINVLLRGVKDGKLSIPYLQGLLKPTKIWWNVSRNRQDPLRISSTFEGAQAADYEDLTKAA